MPRIQTLTVAASLASRKSPVRSSNGPAPAVRRAPAGSPVARRRGAAHERHAGCDLLALPHAREVDGVRAAHHRIEHEPHALTAQARRVERERVPARRRPEIAERVGGAGRVERQ